MTKGTFPKTIESAEYDFMLIRGLENENKKLKEAINDVLEVFEGVGVVNTDWIQKRLLEVKNELNFKQQEQ
jgi:hypothetical protein